MQLEQQGKIIVRTHSFDSAIRDLEKAETQVEKDAAQLWLERAYDREAERRSEELGGTKSENETFLREAVRTRPTSDFVDIDRVKLGIESLSATGPLPMMLVSVILLGWLLMLICQGEGLELDLQRRRHPVWEWLFSHPVKQSAVFLAEMLSPVAANPIYVFGPIFPGREYV